MGPITTSQKTNKQVDDLLIEMGIGLRYLLVRKYAEMKLDQCPLEPFVKHTMN